MTKDVIQCADCAFCIPHTLPYVVISGYHGTCRRLLFNCLDADFAYVHRDDFCSRAQRKGGTPTGGTLPVVHGDYGAATAHEAREALGIQDLSQPLPICHGNTGVSVESNGNPMRAVLDKIKAGA